MNEETPGGEELPDEGTAAPESGAENADTESRAKRMGWTPKEKFKGDPDRWISAEDFVARGENELPILRERNRTLDRRLENTERELSGLKTTMGEQTAVLTEFRDFARKGEERAFTRAKAELEAQHRRQVAAADVDGADATRRELVELETTKPAKPAADPLREKPKTPDVHPEVLEFVEREPWFKANATMRAVAIARHTELFQEQPNLSMSDNLAEVKREIQRRFPEKFDNPARRQAAAVSEPSTTGPRKSNGRGYADLPAEAKKVCDRYLKQIPGYTKEEYCKTYFAGEA